MAMENIVPPIFSRVHRQKDLPHRKRKPEELVNRLWTDEEMIDLIEKINKGFKYQDVTDGTHVPISTLWTR